MGKKMSLFHYSMDTSERTLVMIFEVVHRLWSYALQEIQVFVRVEGGHFLEGRFPGTLWTMSSSSL